MDPRDVGVLLDKLHLGDFVQVEYVKFGLISQRQAVDVGFLVEVSFKGLGLSDKQPALLRISEMDDDFILEPYNVRRYGFSDLLAYNVINRRDDAIR